MLYPYKQSKQSIFIVIVVFFLLSCAKLSEAQTFNIASDLQLIQQKKLSIEKHSFVRPYIYKNDPKSFKTLNPISLTYGALLFVYQNSISQHFSADCLYHPSCSEFSKQCVHQYGFIKGGLLTIDRLNRCNRIAGADIRPWEIDLKTQNCNDPISKYK